MYQRLSPVRSRIILVLHINSNLFVHFVYCYFKYYHILFRQESHPNSQSDTDPNQNDQSTHENTHYHDKSEPSSH